MLQCTNRMDLECSESVIQTLYQKKRAFRTKENIIITATTKKTT